LYDASGNPQMSAAWQSAPGNSPWWANFVLTVDDGLSGFFGNDSLAGGADGDMIFGQAGDDVIQGDGSIGLNVGAIASPGQSAEDAGDGDDYIEGNSGRDLLYGNLGQDDIVGGSSDQFDLNTAARRNDDFDLIFGGAGARTGANDPGDASPNGHARDADVILGDNGNIFHVLDASGSPLTFNFDTYGPLKIVPRVVQMLDYTAGGAATDIGGHDVVHGEAGDDIVHGMAGNDILFGQGQDDDLYGEAGHDRVYGGAGEDGILGDDDVIRTSRNDLTEPLHALTAPNAQSNITLPGPFTGAWFTSPGGSRRPRT
jgi:Ca2+-binding RTX toxin-like protein